jgi:hypothetical protein
MDCGTAALPLAWKEENQIVYCGSKTSTIRRYEARGTLSLREFRLSLRDKNRPGTLRRRPDRSKFALLLR